MVKLSSVQMAQSSTPDDCRVTTVSHELSKSYEPGAIERRWAAYWIEQKLFHVQAPAKDDPRPVFSLLLPPPNLTGFMQLGHMFEQARMTIMVRLLRMPG